jgi:hypothetical protein
MEKQSLVGKFRIVQFGMDNLLILTDKKVKVWRGRIIFCIFNTVQKNLAKFQSKCLTNYFYYFFSVLVGAYMLKQT